MNTSDSRDSQHASPHPKRRAASSATPAPSTRGARGGRKKSGHKTKTNRSLPPKIRHAQTEALAHLAATEDVSHADRHWFRRRIQRARSESALAAIQLDLEQAREKFLKKTSSIPEVTYPEALPVSQHQSAIKAAIEEHQVVIIAGETGSGKTTQIPKICLELGRGRKGLIGHTQPRRLAARTVAERIAKELDQNIGETVGYAIRFDDQVSDTTAIKLMTDGILLAEMQRDKYLNNYDTIIIDEAHERSLNIDFLLGYLKQLLPKRPDLKVIITSATIDPERFAEHFAAADGSPAPIIEVSGRTYPVEIRYRPLEATVGDKIIDIDPLDGVVAALEELMREGEGDILCFFAGEADIREAMETIEAQHWKGVEVTPLFGRLSNQEQHKVFRPHAGRRIVLATNIAETSLTVPSIHYVVDTGTARISRYSTRTKVQRLPIEPISQASANQRSGRCGRVADGIAIRLYSEQDFLSRPAFTDPEILRTNLANVILQMASLHLGDIENFPFLQAPDTRAIRDGLLLLHELGALAEQDQRDRNAPVLTAIGKTMARIPLDPRLARMLIEAEKLGCLGAVYVVVAGLSIQDIRERPLEQQAQADQLHARFKHASSDFLAMLLLWEHVQSARASMSGNAFKKAMQQQFLHYLRIREWFDLVRQLLNIGDQLGWSQVETTIDAQTIESQSDVIHQSLLAGLLSQIGVRESDTKQFIGARNTHFMVFPSSGLAKKPPQFVVAAQLVETSRLWARDVAAIAPEWVERLGAHLLKHQYSEPFWSSKRGSAMVHQRSTLYGVPVVVDRVVGYHKINPAEAREMFIREALVAGNWHTHHKFYHQNKEKLAQAQQLEDKARRRDLVVDDETLVQFYQQRLGDKVTNAQTFHSWWKQEERKHPQLLDFDPDALLSESAQDVTEEAFPDKWRQNMIDFDLSYRFDPTDPFDGVTLRIPVPLLSTIRDEGFEWLVPGFYEELVTALIKTLPKHLRRQVVPAPDYARKVVGNLRPEAGELRVQLAHELQALGGSGISAEDFNLADIPAHLKMTFAAVDRHKKIIDSDKDLHALQRRRSKEVQASVSKVSAKAEQARVAKWTKDTLGTIAEEVSTVVDGQEVKNYPTLVAAKDGVAVRVVGTRAEAEQTLLQTTITLLLRDCNVSTQRMLNGLALQQRVAVENYPHGGAAGFVDDAKAAAVRDLIAQNGGPVRDPDEYQTLRKSVQEELPRVVRKTVVDLSPSVSAFLRVRDELAGWSGDAIDDMQRQLDFWFPRFAITRHGVEQLRHIPRYAQAIHIRLEEMQLQPERDEDRQVEVEQLYQLLNQKQQSSRTGISVRKVHEIRWLIEELRVSLFAQKLGTAKKASSAKITKLINQL